MATWHYRNAGVAAAGASVGAAGWGGVGSAAATVGAVAVCSVGGVAIGGVVGSTVGAMIVVGTALTVGAAACCRPAHDVSKIVVASNASLCLAFICSPLGYISWQPVGCSHSSQQQDRAGSW